MKARKDSSEERIIDAAADYVRKGMGWGMMCILSCKG
jgi:hypothetical protein